VDPERDIAVLKVNSSSALPFLDCLGQGHSPPRVGERVYAIGNPKGLSNTISEGILSALRAIDNEDVIQHTAAISPGSSGGALLDANGVLLGINSWQMTEGQNLNFAIPAKYLAAALIAARNVNEPVGFPPEAGAPAERPGQEGGATNSSIQSAMAALHTLADSIEACPEDAICRTGDTSSAGCTGVRSDKDPLDISRVHFSPPQNVVWDLIPSKGLPSPYTGYVEFSISMYFRAPLERLIHFQRAYPGMSLSALPIGSTPDGVAYSAMPQGTKPAPTGYRYEFDIGPEGLVLRKAMSRSSPDASWERKGRGYGCVDRVVQKAVIPPIKAN
jgi:trypsin-like peptidase